MDESTSPSPLPSPVASKESTPPTPPDNENSSKNDNTSSASSITTTTTSTSGAKKVKKIKPISRAPIATGISTHIPVTGEKPKPIQEGDASLEDNVLYSIFVILYEKDPNEEGMTVKQLCEKLETLHPELVNMSSKTSNLVSAKLNAYIKKLEKTDSSLKYAISREWADASPKRMVYKYRGLLAPGWEKVMEELKKSEQYEQMHNNNNDSMKKVETSVKNLDLSDNDNDNEDVGPTSKKVTKKQQHQEEVKEKSKQKQRQMSQSASVSPKQQVQQKGDPLEQTLQLQVQQEQQLPQQPTKRRATMFDFGRRPSFLNLDEFPEPPPPYLVNKSKITPVIDDDEVFIDVDEEDDEQDDDHRVVVKKRRTISSISKFNWGNLGATELDTAAITAMRRESVSMFEVGVCFPSPSDTSLQDLDKMF
ncbi:Protein GDS1 [Candida tropicalis]